MDKLKKLEQMIGLIESDKLTHDEFAQFFQAFTKVITDLKQVIDRNSTSLKSDYEKSLSQVSQSVSEAELYIKQLINLSEVKSQKNVKDLSQRLSSEINRVEQSMPSMPDLSVLEAKISQVEASMPKIVPPVPETGEEIVNKINDLPIESDFQIDIEHIKGLEKELDDLKKKISKKGYTVSAGSSSSGGGKIVKAYDLSPLLNGVLKTFSLPAFWRVITVVSSSFPIAFRENVDYTIDAGAMTITFTSEIDASTALASGNTITIIYSEA